MEQVIIRESVNVLVPFSWNQIEKAYWNAALDIWNNIIGKYMTVGQSVIM